MRIVLGGIVRARDDSCNNAMLHRQAPAPNDRLAAEDARINGDPAKKGIFLNLCHCRYPFWRQE